jgi:transketolase
MPKTPIASLQREALALRKVILGMIHQAGSGHCGGSLSCVEILVALYEEILRIRPGDPFWPDRDRFILSKGHAAPALYAILARHGFIDAAELFTLRSLGSRLQGHPCRSRLPGMEIGSGPLGMGISVGIGMALAARLQHQSYRVVVLCGDGEMQEGQNWEAFMAAAKWNLDNLTVVIDRNHVQLDGTEQEVMPMGDLAGKIAAFGWQTIPCNGHDIGELIEVLQKATRCGRPCAVVAETVKGRGVSFMEGRSEWHGKPLGKEDYALAMQELEATFV